MAKLSDLRKKLTGLNKKLERRENQLKEVMDVVEDRMFYDEIDKFQVIEMFNKIRRELEK
jgi:hypothetical protein